MSHLPHIAQRHPWHQAIYALGELVSHEKARKPVKKEAPVVATPGAMFWITFRTLIGLFVYTYCMPYFLRAIFFFVPLYLAARWFTEAMPATSRVACGFTETLDTLATLINREHAKHLEELANNPIRLPGQEGPLKPCDSGHEQQQEKEEEEEEEEDDDDHTIEEQKQSPVNWAIELQWQQLQKHLEEGRGKQHIGLPGELLNQHEPLFEVNRDRLQKQGYACVQTHCFAHDCLVLLTSERKQQQPQQQNKKQCHSRDCDCSESYFSFF